MGVVLKGALAAAALAGSTVAATAPAQADRGTGAVIAGIAGLAVGAAIASDHHGSYYAQPAGYYGDGYDYGYAPSYGYGYAPSYGYGYAPAYGYAYRGGYDYRAYRGDHHRYRDGWGDRRWHRDGYDRGGRRDWDRDGRR